MLANKQDIANAIRAQFGKHARIDKIEQSSMAQMTAERGETYKRSEEKKRQEGEYGRYMKSKAKHSPRATFFSDGTGQTGEFEEVDARDNNGHRFVCRVCESKNGEYREVKWLEKYVEAYHMKTPRGWRWDTAPILDVTKKKPAPEEVPPYPKMRVPVGTHEANGKPKRLIEVWTRRAHGGGELSNENIGGQMVQHADPRLKKELFARGVLQVRKDQNGNDQVYMVAGSRKRQQEILKEYNRRQRDARDRGWRGTHSSEGMGVKFINHGGLNVDVD